MSVRRGTLSAARCQRDIAALMSRHVRPWRLWRHPRRWTYLFVNTRFCHVSFLWRIFLRYLESETSLCRRSLYSIIVHERDTVLTFSLWCSILSLSDVLFWRRTEGHYKINIIVKVTFKIIPPRYHAILDSEILFLIYIFFFINENSPCVYDV